MLNIEEIKAKYSEAFSYGDNDRMWDSLSDIPILIEQHEQDQQQIIKLKKELESSRVHCKDCKFLGIKDFAIGYCKKNMCGIIYPEDFCSRGKKKESAD